MTQKRNPDKMEVARNHKEGSNESLLSFYHKWGRKYMEKSFIRKNSCCV